MAKKLFRSKLVRGRYEHVPRKMSWLKLLQSLVCQTLARRGQGGEVFLLSDGRCDLEDCFEAFPGLELHWVPYGLESFWDFFREPNKEATLCFLGVEKPIFMSRSQVEALVSFFPTLLSVLQESLLSGILQSLAHDKAVLIEERSGKFSTLSFAERCLESIEKGGSGTDGLISLLNPEEAQAVGFSLGCVSLNRQKLPLKTLSLAQGQGKAPLEPRFYQSQVLGFFNWVESHRAEGIRQMWIATPHPVLSLLCGEYAVRKGYVAAKQLVFSDVVFGFQPLGTSLQFLESCEPGSGLLLITHKGHCRYTLWEGDL